MFETRLQPGSARVEMRRPLRPAGNAHPLDRLHAAMRAGKIKGLTEQLAERHGYSRTEARALVRHTNERGERERKLAGIQERVRKLERDAAARARRRAQLAQARKRVPRAIPPDLAAAKARMAKLDGHAIDVALNAAGA